MLAESVEDRIFELVDELDELAKKHGGLENLPDDVRKESGKLTKDKYFCHHVISSHMHVIYQLFLLPQLRWQSKQRLCSFNMMI